MHNSDDDVMIIDSSSSASDAPAPQNFAELNSSHGSAPYSEDGGGSEYEDTKPRSLGNAAAAASFKRNTSRSTALEEAHQRQQSTLQSLPLSMRVAVDTQTDAAAASVEDSEALHRHLQALDVALGIRVAPAQRDASAECHGALTKFISSWREAAKTSKRPRRDVPLDSTTDQDPSADATQVKVAKSEVTHSSTASPLTTSTPAWAEQLTAAVGQCQQLMLELAAHADAEDRDSRGEAVRARLAPRSAPRFSSSPPAEEARVETAAGSENATRLGASCTTTTSKPVATNDESSSTLVREAETICAREHKTSLLPLYTELHTLRRQHAQKQREEAQSVSAKLQWEQRLLTDVLAECDAQLDFMNTNFVEACRGNLAPLDALHRRMQALQSFQHQLRAAETSMAPVPLPCASGRAFKDMNMSGAAAAGRPQRPLGRAGETLTKHFDDERHRLQAALDAARAQIERQDKQSAELRSCYEHVTAQVQHTLDAENYVDKEVIAALRQQHHESLATLAQQFGWTLVNSTPDVLSLRHPRTGEVLHANHTYNSINGKPCGEVAKTLAEYVVRHAATCPVAPPAISDGSSNDDGHDSDEDTSGENAVQHTPEQERDEGEVGEAAVTPLPSPPASRAESEVDGSSTMTSHLPSEAQHASAGTQPPPAPPVEAGREEEVLVAEVRDNTPDRPFSASPPHMPSSGDDSGDEEGREELSEEPSAVTEDVDEGEREEDEGEEGEEEEGDEEEGEEEFVNYSNLLNDEAADSRPDTNGVVSEPVDSAEAQQPPASQIATPYTGFFDENALWEEES